MTIFCCCLNINIHKVFNVIDPYYKTCTNIYNKSLPMYNGLFLCKCDLGDFQF